MLTTRMVNHLYRPKRTAGLLFNLMRSRIQQVVADQRRKKYWARAHSIVEGLDRPTAPEGVAVFLNCGFLRDGAMYTLVMRQLIARNWHVASLHDDLPMSAAADQILGELDGMFLQAYS